MFEMGSTVVLIWSMLFGSIGVGFFIYGKRQKAIVPLCAGVALCAFPYFIAKSPMSMCSSLWVESSWPFRILCESDAVV